MDYRDALAECLEIFKNGGDLRRAVAAYPRYAADLQDDIALAAELQDLPATIILPSGALAQGHSTLSSELLLARSGARVSAEASRSLRARLTGVVGPRPPLIKLAVASAVGVAVAFIVLSLSQGGPSGGSIESLIRPSSSAEAAVAGVVLENTDGVLTVQTPDGLATVNVGSEANITAEDGSSANVGDILPGQVVQVNGQLQGDGSFAAVQVDRQPQDALTQWCAVNAAICQAVIDRIETQSQVCPPTDPNCQLLAQELADLLEQVALNDVKPPATEAAPPAVTNSSVPGKSIATPVPTSATNTTVALKRQLADLQSACEDRHSQCQKLQDFCLAHASLCNEVPKRLLK